MTKAEIDCERATKAGRDGRESRRTERTALVVRVDYSTVDTFFSEFTTNINEGGMFIETDSPSPLGTRVLVQFLLPGTDDPLKLDGRVVWASPPDGSAEGPGMGIEFENLDDTARLRINDVVRTLRSDGGPKAAAGRANRGGRQRA
jgi:type IV pilus assembly protein PilZ